MLSRRPAIAVAALALAGLGTAACTDAAAKSAPSAVSGATQPPARQSDFSTAEAVPPAAKPLAGKVIVIDPGHNGGNYRHPEIVNKQVNVLTKMKACDTTGTATNSGYTEAAFTFDVANRLARMLTAKGATVKLTRTSNTTAGPCITQRAAIGNKAKADAAISIHADGAAASGHGFHVIMPKKINGPVDPVVGASRTLGLTIRDSVRKITGLPYANYIAKNALDYRSDLGGLNLSTVPKVFIESGNMRNAGDAAKLKDPKFRQRLASALATGFQNYLK